MLELFYPRIKVDTIYDINIDELETNNIRGLILDIDNTLVGHGIIEADSNVLEWIEKVKKTGMKICIVSNNTKDRVIKFTESLKIPAIHRASKPRKKAFIKAAKMMDLLPHEVAVIGDQIFTDILGGNRLGMITVLVNPVDFKEPFFIKIKRFFEKIVMIGFDKK